MNDDNDPRLPDSDPSSGLAGRWRGWWEQAHLGRQPMELRLRCGRGALSGRGTDMVGPFSLHGTYDSQGQVRIVKQYDGRHEVLYLGRHDSEGKIGGRWSIGGYSGGNFCLFAAPVSDDEGEEIR